MSTYCFVRHAKKVNNNNTKCKFRLDSDITVSGDADAVREAKLLVGRGYNRIVCSPYLRTRKTAIIYATVLGIEDVSVDSLLSECLCHQKVVRDGDIRQSTLKYSPIGIETSFQFAQRMSRLVDRVIGTYGITTIFVTHGFNITTLSKTSRLPLTYIDMGTWRLLEFNVKSREERDDHEQLEDREGSFLLSNL